MLALLDSGTYNTYQLIDWQVDWTNSSTTVTEDGIGFKLGAPDASFTHADMVAEPAISADTYFTDNVTPVFDGWGRAPLVSEYWESGAPIGITTARRAVLYWRGKIAADSSWLEGTGDIWLGFAGSGSVKVIHDGTIVLAGAPLDTDSIRYTSLLDVTEDDVIEIYYWQLNEAWGGIVGKYIPQPTVTDTTPTTAMYREAPVISASLLPYEAETPGVTLPRVTSADLSVNSPNDASTMKFTVPLASSDETLGWSVSNSPRVIQHYDGTDTHTLRRYNLVTLSGGFQGELYDRFTGYLNNFQESDGKITVECFSTDRRLAMAQVENYPDRMSYLTFGYFKKETSSEPVQDIPAYDAWPLEHAIKDLCYKAGVDPKRFAAVRQYNNAGTLTDKEDLFAGTKSKLFNATSVSGDLITLQRQSRYGNSGLGFNEHKSADEAYIYGPDTAKTVIDWVRALADGLGYDFRVNGSGDFVLSSRNNPHRASEITEGSSVFNAGAYGGFYQNLTSSFTATNKVYASRIDLVVGRHEDLGEVDYTVYYGDGVNSGTVASAGTMDISLAGDTTGTFLYDDRFTLSGDNAAIVTLHTGDWRCYVVELSEGEGTQWWLDTLLLYDHDPATSQYAESFKTNKAALSLVTDSQATDARNRVVVIGKRKSAVTDSAKFRNPNNPSSEFAVAVGADPGSIWDPTTDNYVGTKLSTIIVDDKIADQDYADWVAQTLLVRQCAPAPAPEFTHTLIPIMEPRDPITVADSAYGTVTDDVQAWVVGYTEKYTVSEAISSIRATSYSEIPSYEPKEDINLATLDSQFGGKPVAGLSITYTSLDNVVTD
ncbi:MAG: hypothetical protein KOO63_04230, partial [Bacteroidales bacterium]|nr:hypothetical protein [Candidatus Latescibacterota bacterium]